MNFLYQSKLTINQMKIRVSIFFISLFGLLLIFGSKKHDKKSNDIQTTIIKDKQPNILIIFPDQLRRYSAGFWSKEPYKKLVFGNPDPVITPTIDELAENGIVFTNAVSNYPVCSPYRGMLLSGVYPEQNGIWNNCSVGREESLKNDIPTLPSLFKEANYNTAYIGKAHWIKPEPTFDKKGNYVATTTEPGGNFINNYDTYIPPGKQRHGIEYFYQSVKDDHFNPIVFSNDPFTIEGKIDGEIHYPKQYSPKSESTVIIDYLKNNRNQRDADKPFLMIWSLNPPHNPWDDKHTDLSMVEKFYNKEKYPEIDENLVVRNNANLENAHHARNYFAAVSSVDYYIGLVLSELKSQGMLDNTIVIFSSDHGEMLGSHGKQGKNQMELEATAIPFIVHWPKKLQPRTTDLLLSVPDILPTVMGLSGLKENIPKTIEGSDFSSYLINKKTSTIKKPTASLLMIYNARGVLTDRYTLVIQKNNNKKIAFTSYIYDNEKDPYQQYKILLEEQSELAKKLLKELAILLKKTNDPWYQKRELNHLIPY